MGEPQFFGIRHLSPAGAYYLEEFLNEKRPKLVLIEGPEDFGDMIADMTRPETQPPIAVMAYTKEAPLQTILYPFAGYSPEYRAIQWCAAHQVPCRFMDLPSGVFLAVEVEREKLLSEQRSSGVSVEVPVNLGEECRMDVYGRLDEVTGEDGEETFWERTMEHAKDARGYREGAWQFGKQLRELTAGKEADWMKTATREAYMMRKIRDAVDEGYKPEEIVVVTGAYHVEGLRNWNQKRDGSVGMEAGAGPISDAEITWLPQVESCHTLMPYSYYRLSTRSGYGAGNKAPAYYGILWDALHCKDPLQAAYQYMAKIAGYQRENGTSVSSAETIEAVRLAMALAGMRGNNGIPSLRDLRDAAVTLIGSGSFSAVSQAIADTEIGTEIGRLPDGVSRTSIQEDFYRQMKDLKLEKYRSAVMQNLTLDLRENRKAATEKTAFLDLSRSFFLHRLRVMGISFAKQQSYNQKYATWAEKWVACWTPEAEIELVEAALYGDTVVQAASFAMKERVEQAKGMAEIAEVIEDAFACGMPEAVCYATTALRTMAVDETSLEELAQTAHRLSTILLYGNIRKLNAEPLIPILCQIFCRSARILPTFCACDDSGSKRILTAVEQLNMAELAHDFLDHGAWLSALGEIAKRDDLNTKLSGFAAAILLERGKMDSEELHREVGRRLSKGVPADLGAGWFEGLAMKNRYVLLAKLSLWESLDSYLESLDSEEFKRALVFLRRAFAEFTSMEKDQIAENLGEIWGLNGQQVSEAVNARTTAEEMKLLDSLADFDFDIA